MLFKQYTLFTMSNTMSLFILTIVGLFFASSINAEEIHNYRMCRHSRCEIYHVFVDPCPEASRNQPCEIPQGVNATIQFSYKTNFGSIEPKARLYAETLVADLPFMDMDTNACLYTSCPLQANTKQNWEYHLLITDHYPKNFYTVKLRFWDGAPKADKKDECCFKFEMMIA